MKTIKFIFSVLVGVLLLGCCGQSILAAEAVAPIETKQQWEYIQNSLDQHVVGAHKTLRMVEKVLKYGVAPAAPVVLGWIDGMSNLFITAECSHSKLNKFLTIQLFAPNVKLGDTYEYSTDFMFYSVCALVISGSLYALTDKLFSTITSSQNHNALKKLLVEWHTKRDQIPASLLPLVDTLYSEAQAGSLTADQSNKALAALIAMSAVVVVK